MTKPRKLHVFLCHASQDKPVVRELYHRLSSEKWIDPWLDEEKLFPGQDWDLEIEKAVEGADAVIVCVSARSVTKEGYIQKEIRKVLDIALEKPEETIFIIPIRLDDCDLPRRLRSWHYVDFFPAERRDWAFRRLLESLKRRSADTQPEERDQIAQPRVQEPLPVIQKMENPPEKETGVNKGAIGWSIALVLYFLLSSLDAFTPSDDMVEFLLGTFAILSGIVMLMRKQIPATVLFKFSLIIYLLIYGPGYRLDDIISYAPYIAGLAALISGGIIITTIGASMKHVFYSSISFAVFLFLVGVYEIVTNFGYSAFSDTLDTLILITSIVTSVLLWREL
jgi:hypothetical protein